MDKETMMLELVGLSRVVDGEVRELIHKSYVLGNLADKYEPINPFIELAEDADTMLRMALDHAIFRNLSADERTAFLKQWKAIPTNRQMTILAGHVGWGS